ncbi:hypothetical protein LXA43DRAFT_1005997 [Ganoderma leucocontextum]|nr:hypothetical protein LXA43DRAFT_1005997 [Ganoderma leucocontextum]
MRPPRSYRRHRIHAAGSCVLWNSGQHDPGSQAITPNKRKSARCCVHYVAVAFSIGRLCSGKEGASMHLSSRPVVPCFDKLRGYTVAQCSPLVGVAGWSNSPNMFVYDFAADILCSLTTIMAVADSQGIDLIPKRSSDHVRNAPTPASYKNDGPPKGSRTSAVNELYLTARFIPGEPAEKRKAWLHLQCPGQWHERSGSGRSSRQVRPSSTGVVQSPPTDGLSRD